MGDHMDEHLILEFSTQEAAQACLDAINSLAAQWWVSQGYTVIDGQLIGKNAATGQDQPDRARTITWAEIQQSPENTYYFASLSNDEKFKNWKQALADIGFTAIGTEKQKPAEWDETED